MALSMAAPTGVLCPAVAMLVDTIQASMREARCSAPMHCTTSYLSASLPDACALLHCHRLQHV